MEKQPDFLRNFSKENSHEERDETANKIRAKRKEAFLFKNNVESEKESLKLKASTHENNIERQQVAIDTFISEIEDLNSNGLVRLENYFKLRKIREELALVTSKNRSEIQAGRGIKIEEERMMEKEKLTDYRFEDAQRILENFYISQKRKWGRAPYDKEEMREAFSESHLESLSMDDFILLLRRFPNEMVTHVTRQGIRDHTGHMYHTAGIDTYMNGFQRIIEDGRLRSALGICLVEKEKENAIARLLELDKFETKENALEILGDMASDDLESGGGYADIIAIHFATEDVADEFYGSEQGNEIFFAFPGAHIASQYFFSGQLSSSAGGYWNDQWVWANEEKGVGINAGVTFIPDNTPVNVQTGSKYELSEDMKPIINQEYVDSLTKLISWDGFEEFAEGIENKLGTMRHPETYWNTQNPDVKKFFQLLTKQLADDFGITDEKLLNVIFDYTTMSHFRIYKDNKSRISSEIPGALRRFGLLFVEAKDSITSKEYWENYFSRHPDKKPKRIVYYQGSDPTKALFDWKDQNNIGARHRKNNDPELGFSGSRVTRDSLPAIAGRDRFRSLATKVIEEYFAEKD